MDNTITSSDVLLAPTHLNYTALLESLGDYLQVILVCNIVILNPEYNLGCVIFYCFLLFFTVFYCQCELFQTVPVRSDLFHFTLPEAPYNSAPDKPLPGLLN